MAPWRHPVRRREAGCEAQWHRCGLVVQDGDSPAERVAFLYDGDNVCADIVNAAGALAVSRFYVTPFLDQNLFMTDFAADGAKMYCYSQDGLGSVRTLTDKAGEVVNKYDYTAFGEKWTAGTSEGVGQRYAYTGREVSPSTETICNRYRIYSSFLGRFLSIDPIDEIRNLSGNYCYVGNNPTSWTDPYGTYCEKEKEKLEKTKEVFKKRQRDLLNAEKAYEEAEAAYYLAAKKHDDAKKAWNECLRDPSRYSCYKEADAVREAYEAWFRAMQRRSEASVRRVEAATMVEQTKESLEKAKRDLEQCYRHELLQLRASARAEERDACRLCIAECWLHFAVREIEIHVAEKALVAAAQKLAKQYAQSIGATAGKMVPIITAYKLGVTIYCTVECLNKPHKK